MRLVKARADIRAWPLAVVALAMALVASGCHVPGTSGSGSSDSGQLTVGIVAGVDNAPVQVAAQDGLFRDQGLNVVVKTYHLLSDEFQALKNGNVDIAAGDYADFFYADAVRQASLRLVADGYDAAANVMEVLSLPGSGITTPQGLEHKVVATPQAQLIPPFNGPYSTDVVPFSMETLATESVLESNGIPTSTVRWKPMPVADMIDALRSGQVSAILATEPNIIEAESQLGAVEVLDSASDQTAGLPLSGYFSLAAFADAHPAELQQFRTAMASAQADAANRESLQAMLPHLTAMSSQDAALITLGSYPTSLSVGQVQRVADLMYDSGLIGSPLSVSRLAGG